MFRGDSMTSARSSHLYAAEVNRNMEDPCPWPQGQGAWLRWAVKSGISSSPSLPALPLLHFVLILLAYVPAHSRVTLTRALRRENSCCDPLTPWLWWVTQLPPATWVSMSGFLDSLGHTVCTLNCWILIKAGYKGNLGATSEGCGCLPLTVLFPSTSDITACLPGLSIYSALGKHPFSTAQSYNSVECGFETISQSRLLVF